MRLYQIADELRANQKQATKKQTPTCADRNYLEQTANVSSDLHGQCWFKFVVSYYYGTLIERILYLD